MKVLTPEERETRARIGSLISWTLAAMLVVTVGVIWLAGIVWFCRWAF